MRILSQDHVVSAMLREHVRERADFDRHVLHVIAREFVNGLMPLIAQATTREQVRLRARGLHAQPEETWHCSLVVGTVDEYNTKLATTKDQAYQRGYAEGKAAMLNWLCEKYVSQQASQTREWFNVVGKELGKDKPVGTSPGFPTVGA